MRTNIVLDDQLVQEAMHLSGIRTKRAVINAALQSFVRLQRQRAVLTLEGAISWHGDLDSMRSARHVADEEAKYDAGSG